VEAPRESLGPSIGFPAPKQPSRPGLELAADSARSITRRGARSGALASTDGQPATRGSRLLGRGAMTTAEASGRKKRRKMKQMQGLLLLARVEEAALANAKARHATKPRRLNVVLQPQLLELAYSALVRARTGTRLGLASLLTARVARSRRTRTCSRCSGAWTCAAPSLSRCRTDSSSTRPVLPTARWA
jgi:hypothetical protein